MYPGPSPHSRVPARVSDDNKSERRASRVLQIAPLFRSVHRGQSRLLGRLRLSPSESSLKTSIMKLNPRRLITLGPIRKLEPAAVHAHYQGEITIPHIPEGPCGERKCTDWDGESGTGIAAGVCPGILSGAPVLDVQLPCILLLLFMP